MKRIISLTIALCLIFGSFSLCFAAVQDVSDSQTHTSLGNIYNLLNGSSFSGKLNNIFNKLTDINYNLVTLMGWLDPATGGGTTALLNQILNALTYTDAGGLVKSWLVDIQGYNYQTAERLLDLNKALTHQTISSAADIRNKASLGLMANTSGDFSYLRINGTQLGHQTVTHNWSEGTPLGNFMLMFKEFNQSMIYNALAQNQYYNDTQTFYDHSDLSTDTFTPTSSTNGIYQWLSHIQAPVARLSYVLASDERIAAQEAAAANEEAVVDNFIDSNGTGSASTSDIGSISDLSSGYKNNFGSDASVSGIFNIFNSNNMGWFSQETKNQLDTTSRSRSVSNTPLLDQQIHDIFEAIGVEPDESR